VSVGHTHHDYPAADIAAPEGSPVYMLADAVIERAWTYPDPRCGIGVTFRTADGDWTYCHLSYLEPTVTAGVTLPAGDPVGLVGHTGDATGPHLHLQLNPSTEYPQDQPWFQQFAGTAFRWQDAPTPERATQRGPVFAEVPSTPRSAPGSGGVIRFTR
jgi:murein DD-endopeptidase MepM/ murein hydrolase activator NlpD